MSRHGLQSASASGAGGTEGYPSAWRRWAGRPIDPRLAVILCVIVTMMDGYDILILSFAAPLIRLAWRLTPQQLGVLFASGVAGMAVGGIALAPLADRLGRRTTVLWCLLVATVSMLFSAASQSFAQLMVCRFATGLGVGGMMPVINSVVAELAARRWRNLKIAIQAAGYPIGGTVGGVVALAFMSVHGWRWLLWSGGCFSAVLTLLVWASLPESLVVSGIAGSSVQGTHQVDRRPSPAQRVAFSAVLGPDLLRSTVLICGATFLVQFSFYFIVNWLPSLLVAARSNLGLPGAVWLNLGGIPGDIAFGLLALRFRPRLLGASATIACFTAVLGVAGLPRAAWLLLPATCVTGSLLFASMASIYVIAPAVFPPLARSTGTGLALSVGRIGAILGPIAGGLLMGNAPRTAMVILVLLASPLVMASLLLASLRRTPATDGEL